MPVCGIRFRSAVFLLLVLILSVLGPANAAAPAAPISAIEVTGNRRIDTASVLRQLGLSAADGYDAASANRALKDLYATGFYADARIDRVGQRLVVTVVENPLVAEVTFTGNVEFDAKTLAAEAAIRTNDIYTLTRAHDSARRLQALYARKGRHLTTVEPTATVRADGRVDLAFAIKESDESKLLSIRFVGNAAFSQAQLKDAIASAESGWLDVFKTNVVYEKERLERDREMVADFYRARGYPDVKVDVEATPVDEAAKGYAVTFTVDEGDPYRFGAISLEASSEGVDVAALRAEIAGAQGETYDVRRVETTLARLNDRLAAGGPTFAQATARPLRDPRAKIVGIAYLVEDGPRITIERIEIAGNTKTASHVIRRELPFTEGDPLNPVHVAKAKKKLIALGFFKSVEIRNAKGATPERQVLTVLVEERDTRELGFGIGYSTNDGITGDVSYVERNLLGNGQSLRLRLEGSQNKVQADIGFTEPRFLGQNLAAGFDVFYRDNNFTQQSSYKSQRAGGAVRLGFPITETISGSVNYTFVRSTIYEVGPDASAAIKEAVQNAPTYDTSSVGYTLAYDTRDSKKNPVKGIYVASTQDVAGLGGDVRYLRSVAEVRGYLPVGNDVTLAGRAIGGNIVGWGGSDVRLLDLFYKGGDLVRGFAPSGLGPRDLASANRDALGGRMFYGTSAEARFAIAPAIGLSGALFADAGSLFGAGIGAAKLPGLAGGTSALRASVGVGLAWESPIGPLRVDYAVPLLKQPFDKTQPLSFGLGPGF